MISLADLKQLFETDLKKKLNALEGERKKILLIYICSFLVLIGSIISIIAFYQILYASYGFVIFIFVALIIASIVYLFKAYYMYRDYRKDYKYKIVNELVYAMDPSWNYYPDEMISPGEYMESNIFKDRYDRYSGDDLIDGTIDKTDFRCSEIKTEEKHTSYDSKGRRRETWVTIFQGLFFHADFNKNFTSKTYVSPDTAEKLFGKWGQKLQKFSGKAKLVALENPEFEREFVVHSSDQIEARYIITPTVMETMLTIQKTYRRPVHFSFIGSRVYCTVGFDKYLFEPRLFSSGVKFKDIEFMHGLFMLNETIIKELNLNTRIWTKN